MNKHMAPRFGESFNPDQGSRVNVLDQEAKVPEYVEFGRNIRSLLKGQNQETGEIKTNWPECPHGLTDLEDFFNAAKDAVAVEWQKASNDLLKVKYQEWLGQIPQTEDNQDIIRLLSNPAGLEDKLKIQQLGELEGLKNILPEAWRALVVASSERQLATLTVLRHWLKNDLSDADLAALKISREEMEVLLDASGVLGKYIDQAYVKQIELADEPGGTTKSKLGERDGAEYIYDPYVSPHTRETKKMSFNQVFAGEWPKVVDGLKMLARRVADLLDKRKLTDKYALLPEYLNHLVALYGSQEISPKKISALWSELDLKINELAKSGCPLMFVPGSCVGVTGDANKIDIELRFGVRTEGIAEMEKSCAEFRQVAQGIVDKNTDKLDEGYSVPTMVLNIQPLSFGSSLQYHTPAETGVVRMLSHVNVNNELVHYNYLPIIARIFPDQIQDLDEAQLKEAVNLDAVLHETSHNVMATEDAKVLKRIGGGTEAIILDEMKAESVSMVLLREVLKQKSTPEAADIAAKQFFAKLVIALDYLANKSSDLGAEGEYYFYPGLAMIERLLDKGILVEENGKYRVTDARQGIEAVADLGEEILNRFYYNDNATPEQVADYINGFRAKKDDVRIKAIKNKITG